jgi:hypothetical protein
MVKLTVQQYANEYKTNVQQVYRQIKKGSLTTVKENGKTLVIIEDTNIKQTLKNDEHNVNDLFINHLINDNDKLNKQLKSKDKEIKRLTKELSKSNKDKEQTLLTYISELKNFQLEYKPKENIEVVTTSDSKKKKSKKKKDKNDK